MTQMSHIYLAVGGHYQSIAEERWQFGIRFLLTNQSSTPDNAGTLALTDVGAVSESRSETDWDITTTWNATSGIDTFHPDDWLNDQVAPALATNFDFKCWADVKVDSVKAYPIATTGNSVGGRVSDLEWTGSFPAGSSSSNPLPLENSLVVSWHTPQIGRRGRGRIYLPVMTTAALDTHGRATTTATTACLASAVSMIQDMSRSRTFFSGGFWVLPIVTGAPWTQYGVITSVTLDDVIDTHRSRRRQESATLSGPTSTSY